jgi:nicotinamidase-related amidase
VPYTTGIFPGHDPLYIGWNWNNTWNGALDEVRVFSGALSPAEIMAEYQNPGGPLPLAVSPNGAFGQVTPGQTATNSIVFTNNGTNDLFVGPLQLSGPDTANFHIITPTGNFILHPGASNSVSALIQFVPDAVRTFSATLTATSTVNTVQVTLTGQGFNAAAPVAWWSFDTPSDLGLDSVGNNNAALVSNPTPGAGKRNGGVLLNGAGQYLVAPDAPSLNITGPMTILVWAKANAVNANYPFLYKASSWDDGQMAYALDLNWFSGGFFPRFWVTSDGHASGYQEVVSPVAMSVNSWHLIAGVYDGTNISVYLDGQLEASVPYTTGIFPGHDPLYIGWNWNNTWNGALDEVRIFNSALTSTQIQEAYQSEMPPLNVSLTGTFGRVPVGQVQTNLILFTNGGTNDLTVTPSLSGTGASAFAIIPASSFVLHPGVGNAVSAQLCFAPGAAQTYDAVFTAMCDSNTVQIPLSGVGVNARTFIFQLEKRDPITGQLSFTPQTLHGSELAIIVMDMWDSHPDPDSTSRVAGMIPRMNETLDAARAAGIQVIWCPNEVLDASFPSDSPYRTPFAGYPNQSQTDNGFDPPLPPYTGSVHGDMVPIAYFEAFRPVFPHWSRQHPDLVVRPGDLASTSRQEIFNFCVANGITHLIYIGDAANMCVAYTREISMIPMKRYCGFDPIMVRDLTDSQTLNGRINTGYWDENPNDSPANLDLTVTPDGCHRNVVAADETYLCSTIDARQLAQFWAPAAYSDLISGDTNLLCYWHMDSQVGYQEILDVRRTQSCWWNKYDPGQTNGMSFGVAGAIANDPNAAAQFNGSTLLVSPMYRDDIPTNSPLVSLSATNFSIEMWVRISASNSNQWFFAHDNGAANGVDVLLGLNASNHFQFVVGSNAGKTAFGDMVRSITQVTPADVASGRWFHLVAVHDRAQGIAAIYLDGKLEFATPHVCSPVALSSAPHFGSRGAAGLGGSQYLGNPGYEFLNGALDEVAIYSTALSADSIRLHHEIGLGNLASTVPLSVSLQNGQAMISWPAAPPGLVLQTATGLASPVWQDCAGSPQLSNGWLRVSAPISAPQQFFRLRNP